MNEKSVDRRFKKLVSFEHTNGSGRQRIKSAAFSIATTVDEVLVLQDQEAERRRIYMFVPGAPKSYDVLERLNRQFEDSTMTEDSVDILAYQPSGLDVDDLIRLRLQSTAEGIQASHRLSRHQARIALRLCERNLRSGAYGQLNPED